MKLEKSFIVVLVFVIVTISYAIAFQVIEGKDILTSFYWTVITMATIGYGDITPETTVGKILAMLMAVTGIAIYTAFASIIVEYITERNIKRLQGFNPVKDKNHVVIIGWNDTTKEAYKELKNNVSCDIVVVSRNPIEHRCVVGDFTDEETLKKAGIERARCVLISTGEDSKTVLTTLLVRKLNPDAFIVAEAIKIENTDLIRFAGAKRVILSKGFAGRLLASAVFEESVVSFFEDVTTSLHGDDIFEIPADDLAGLSVLNAMHKLKEEYNYTLVGLISGGNIMINPHPDEIVKSGDRILVIGRKKY
jgi:voltage-gated potassium channel